MPGARDFTDVDFVRGESPATFFGTVSEGRGEMPPFKDKLSPDDRWNVVFYVWRFSTSSQTLATGKQVYDTNCAACHGPKGSGVVLGAADFTSMELMASGAPRDFYQIVTQGKGSMPSWQGRLSQDDRWAVIDFVRTFTYDPALAGEAATMSATEAAATNAVTEAACDATQSNPVKWDDAEALSAGKEIYQQNCSACHAADGKGALPGAPNFTDPAVQSQIKSTSGEFLCTITSGRGMMPGWKDKLTVDQMWQVLTYIASLAQ